MVYGNTLTEQQAISFVGLLLFAKWKLKIKKILQVAAAAGTPKAPTASLKDDRSTVTNPPYLPNRPKESSMYVLGPRSNFVLGNCVINVVFLFSFS